METIPLQTLFDYDHWACNESLRSLRAMTVPPPKAVAVFAHIAATKRNLLARCQQAAEMPAPFFPDWNLNQSEKVLEEADRLWREYLEKLTPALLAGEIEFKSVTRGGRYRVLRSVAVLQAVLHGQHHRGQIAVLVREGGGLPASTDFIFWPAIGARRVAES